MTRVLVDSVERVCSLPRGAILVAPTDRPSRLNHRRYVVLRVDVRSSYSPGGDKVVAVCMPWRHAGPFAAYNLRTVEWGAGMMVRSGMEVDGVADPLDVDALEAAYELAEADARDRYRSST